MSVLRFTRRVSGRTQSTAMLLEKKESYGISYGQFLFRLFTIYTVVESIQIGALAIPRLIE